MNIQDIFSSFSQLKALIIGDVMVDSYVWGAVDRISPEAPVPVVNAQRIENRLGGAANVALNVQALGAQPILCSVTGNDEEGNTLNGLLQEKGLTAQGIVTSDERITTVKRRILAGSQQLLRVDTEVDSEIQAKEIEALVARVKQLVQGHQIQVIIFEDYDKGVLTRPLIEEVIAFANAKGIPTIVDPKKRNFLSYKGSTLFKPNLKELKEGLNITLHGGDLNGIRKGVQQLREHMPVDSAMITLSEYGIYISNFTEDYLLPAHKREIADVSGAGDTVVSIAGLCLALQLPLSQIAGLANLGGGLVCEHLGVVPVDKARLAEEAQKIYG
ncbi:bifunctional ADP-heptose synthase [Rapidithrix thailandica]|uniref:Bifunctional ADP-heptose synthase n=1 Tax=Rapidithrix thailandica TaxID=413964 RepID=A0AAW9S9S8_9BACT